jgi:16S rRNA (guanine527-N7)-methyltransferase
LPENEQLPGWERGRLARNEREARRNLRQRLSQSEKRLPVRCGRDARAPSQEVVLNFEQNLTRNRKGAKSASDSQLYPFRISSGNFRERNMTAQTDNFRDSLHSEAAAYGMTLTSEAIDGLSQYYELLNSWNSRLHLVAPCSPDEFAKRHVLESLLLIKHFPENASVAEVGAGGGLPILPCLIVRPDISAILIEAAQRKAVFLREALTRTGTSKQGTVIAQRFENGPAPEVGFVTCRALERFAEMLPHLLDWAPAKATLLLFGGKRLAPQIEGLGFSITAELIPQSKGRFLFRVSKP